MSDYLGGVLLTVAILITISTAELAINETDIVFHGAEPTLIDMCHRT